MREWDTRKKARDARIEDGSALATAKIVAPANLTALLQAVVRPGDRV